MAEFGDGQPLEQLKLMWDKLREVPCDMKRGTAVVCDSLAYINSPGSHDVFAYDSKKDNWNKLPECPQREFGLAAINDLLTAVGGLSDGEFTTCLNSFDGGKWLTVFPPMPTKRQSPAVISTRDYLIVAGGIAVGQALSTVDVMDVNTREWFTAASLPECVCFMSATVCEGRLYLLGGLDKNFKWSHAVFSCTLDSLIHSRHQTPPHSNEDNVWQCVADVPVERSTCATLKGRLLAVSGRDSDGNPTAVVYIYNPGSNLWQLLGNMPTARCRCLVVGLRDHIITVGGHTSGMDTLCAAVEVGYLQLSDEERHLAALELAIRQKGLLDKTIMQCVFVGPPCSGKSSLMKRIVGEQPTLSSPSTGVADKVVRVEILKSSTTAASVSGSTWVKLSHDDEAVMVVMDTSHSHSSPTAHGEIHTQASVAVAPANPTELNTTVSASDHRNQLHPHQSPTPATATTQPHPPSPCSSASTNTTDLKLSLDVCRSALRKNPFYAVRASQERGWLVYLTDTGGQIEFQEVLLLLVSGPSVFFLVFRLDHNLNKQFMVEYICSTGEKSKPYQSNFTVKEALLHSLASIASMGTYVSKGEQQVPLRSKVFFVGTHKDKVSQKQINRIDHSLQQLVRSTGLYQEGMIQFSSETQMLLAVNNLSHDDSDVQLVRAAVERAGSQGDFKIRAPSSWLVFSLTIRQHKDRVLSYEQCFEIARQCGIETQEELNEALWFLHTKVGLIRYFQGEGLEDLQKIVIVDPQVLFDVNTELVVETFTFDKVDPAIRECFKKKGIFPFSNFERISRSSEQLLTLSRLVKLLEHLHIIAPLEEEEDGERRYFMPCVLAHTKPAEATSLVKRITRAITAVFRPSAEQTHDNSSSLLIGFRCGYCPKGLFAALVVFLLTDTNSHFQWKLQRDRIFRDLISFSVGPYDTVTITVQLKFLEITCTPASSELARNRHFTLEQTCGEVRCYIERGIHEVTSALHYTRDAAHYLAFYCPGGHRHPDQKELHPAEIYFHDGVPCTLRCELAEGRTFRLPPGHERWFTEGSECSGRQQQGRQSTGETAFPSPPPPSSTAATGSGTACPRIGDMPQMWQLQKFIGVHGGTVRVVDDVCADWEKLAVALNFHGGVIRAVERSQHFQVEGACLTILQRWLDGEGRKPVTWETLIDCLEDIKHSSLAGDLRRELEP